MKPDDPEREGKSDRWSGVFKGAAQRGLTVSRKALVDAREVTTKGIRSAHSVAQKGARATADGAKEGYQKAASAATNTGRAVSVQAQRAAVSATEAAQCVTTVAGDGAQRVATATRDGVQRTAVFISESSGSIASFLTIPELLQWSESLTKSAATIYDKALDANYLRTHIGGGNHRMFDGGHSLQGAWVQVRAVAPEDSFGEAVLAYAEALWKDGTTVKGLPFMTWKQADYDRFADHLCSLPGVHRAWVYDLLSYDVFEVLSAGLGTVGVLFALQRDDLEKLSELLGGMGITSILSANPVMGLMVIFATGFAYSKKTKDLEPSSRLSLTRAASGASLAGFSAALFAVLGLPVLIELGIVLVASHLAKKHVLENEVLHALLYSRFQESREGVARITERFLVLIRADGGAGDALHLSEEVTFEPS